MDNKYISGIYNYCDRWCERCPFTERCMTYQTQQEWEAENPDKKDDFEAAIAHSFGKALELLYEMAEREGIDLDNLDYVEPVLNQDMKVQGKQVIKYVEAYQKLVDNWIIDHETMLTDKGEEWQLQAEIGLKTPEEEFRRLEDAMEVIRWYYYFITAKVSRAFTHYDFGIEEDDPIQNDENGSGKVAIVAIDKSLAAWESIRSIFPDETDSILDIMLQLHGAKKGILKYKPNVMDFVRPGFDEKNP